MNKTFTSPLTFRTRVFFVKDLHPRWHFRALGAATLIYIPADISGPACVTNVYIPADIPGPACVKRLHPR